MTADKYVEQIRDGQELEEDALKKHLGSYRTKDVDQYIEKLINRLHNMETVYQERYEEMRTSLLGMTRERDAQIERANLLEQKFKDMPKYCELYLRDRGLVAIPKEKHEAFKNYSVDDLENIQKQSLKLKSLEQENIGLNSEIENVRAALKDTEEANKELEQAKIQLQAQMDQLSQLNAQVQAQTEQAEETGAKLEALEKLSQNQAIELVQQQSKYQMLELQHRLTQEINQQLTREKDCQANESARQQERWDAQRSMLVQRFNGILNSQKQYMKHLQDSVAATMQYMEKLGEDDFLDAPAAEAEK